MTGTRAQRSMLRDDRGRRVPAVSIRQLAQTDADAGGRRRALVQRVRKQTRDAAYQLAGPQMLWIVIAAVAWSKLEDRIIGRHALQGLPRVAAILAVLCGAGAIFWWWANHAGRRRRSRLALESGFCGSCGYDLMGLPRSDDALIICPECGSAWKLR